MTYQCHVYATREDLNSLVDSVTAFQVSTASYVSQTAAFMGALSNTLLQGGMMFPSKTLMVQQQLQLQACSLQIQQLHGKLAFYSHATKVLQEQLYKMKSLECEMSVVMEEAAMLRTENSELQNVCDQKDEQIELLNERLSQVVDGIADECHSTSDVSDQSVEICDEVPAEAYSEKSAEDEHYMCGEESEEVSRLGSVCDSGQELDDEDVAYVFEVDAGSQVQCGRLPSLSQTQHSCNHVCDLVVCYSKDVDSEVVGTSILPSGKTEDTAPHPLMLGTCFDCFVDGYLDSQVRLPT